MDTGTSLGAAISWSFPPHAFLPVVSQHFARRSILDGHLSGRLR